MPRDGHLAEKRWLRAVLDRYERPLLRYATRLVGDADRARDVVQDVFIRLVEKGDWLRAEPEESEGRNSRAESRARPTAEPSQRCLSPFSTDREQRAATEDRVAQWLFTVCRNRALDLRRKENRMRRLDEATVASYESGDPAPAAALEARETASRALQLLATLPDNQQEVLRLKFQGGLSYKEIASVLDLTVGNVGFLIHTGLKTIREQMAEDAR